MKRERREVGERGGEGEGRGVIGEVMKRERREMGEMWCGRKNNRANTEEREWELDR